MTMHGHEPDSSGWFAANMSMLFIILTVVVLVVVGLVLFRALDDDDGGTIDVDLDDNRQPEGGSGGSPSGSRWVAPSGATLEVSV